MEEGKVKYGIDTDTEKVEIEGYTEPQSVRTWGIDSPESKSSVSRKNTEEGAWSSSMTKALVRKGDILTIDTPTERDVFGRVVSKSSKKFNDKTVDLGFLKASLGLAAYYTDKGIDESTDEHKLLKETYDKRLPFQFSDKLEALDEDKFLEVGTNMMKLTAAMTENSNGADNQAEVDGLVATMYGDGEDENVAKYLAMKKRLLLNRNWENEPLSADKIMYEAYQDPKVQAAWDKAVSNKVGRKKSKGDWRTDGLSTEDKISATLNTFNSVAQVVNRLSLFEAENSDLKVADDMLAEEIAKLPIPLQSSVYDKAKEVGNAGALMYAVQLKANVDSHAIYDDMSLTSQFVWGAAGTLADPTILIGIPIAGKAVQVTKALKEWTINPVLKGLAYAGTWAAASGIEGTVINTPKLIGDHTYTPGDLLLDIALDTTIGTVLPMSVITVKGLQPKITRYLQERRAMKLNAPGQLEKELLDEQTKAGLKGTGTTQERLDSALARREKRDRPLVGSKKGTDQSGQTNGSTVEGDTRTTASNTGGTNKQLLDEVIEGEKLSFSNEEFVSKTLPSTIGKYGPDRLTKMLNKNNEIIDGTDAIADMSYSDRRAQAKTIQKARRENALIEKELEKRGLEGKSNYQITPKEEVPVKIAGRSTEETPEGRNTSAGETDVETTIALSGDLPPINRTPWVVSQDAARAGKEVGDAFEKVGTPKKDGGVWTQEEIDHMESKDRAEDLKSAWIEELDGEHRAATKPATLWEKGTSMFANLTGKVMSHRMQASENSIMRFIGFNLLEDPKGFAGRIRRSATAAMTSVMEREKMLSQIMPDYNLHIDNWAKSKGAMWHQRFKAVWGSQDGNKMVKEFQDEVLNVLNDRKMGRKVARHPDAEKMADTYGKFSDYAHMRATDEGLPGWKNRKRKHYFPQLHNKTKMRNFVLANSGGEKGTAALEMLFIKGMTSARDAGKNSLNDLDIKSIAKEIVKSSELKMGNMPDSKAQIMARARTRVEMDWAVEHDGLKLLDFLETDIPKVANKYASDVSGRLALSKATRGKISTDLDITTLKEVAVDEHEVLLRAMENKGDVIGAAQLKKSFAQEMMMFDDSMNMILGRPTREGLAPELRNLKQLNMLTRMGILGTSQAIETGNIVARSTIDLFSDPDVVKHLFAMSKDSVENKQLLQDIMNITGRTKDMEYLFRPGAVLDEASMAELSNMRQLSVALSDKLTFGSLKETASRALSSTSMFNFVQRNQSALIQKSFLIHVDRYFNTGKSSINPKRMIDLGLMDVNGIDTDLTRVFKDVVLKNEHGHIVDLQWDKWGKSAQEKYMGAAQRDEAQRLQRTFAGETPAYYNKPLMNLLFQFREVPLVAQQKQLARNAAFADKEAVASIMLNIATAGLVRFSWVAGLGYTKSVIEGKEDSFTLPSLNRLDIQRYQASGGLIFDALEIAGDMFEGVERKDPGQFFKGIPQSGLIKDAIDFASGTNPTNSRVEAVQGLTLLGNTWYMDALHTMLVKQADDRAKKYKE